MRKDSSLFAPPAPALSLRRAPLSVLLDEQGNGLSSLFYRDLFFFSTTPFAEQCNANFCGWTTQRATPTHRTQTEELQVS